MAAAEVSQNVEGKNKMEQKTAGSRKLNVSFQ